MAHGESPPAKTERREKTPDLIDRARRLARHPLVRTGFGLAVLAAILSVLVVISRSGDDGGTLVDISEAPGAAGEEIAGLGPLTSGGPRVGQPAPDFALRDLNGDVHRLSDFRGQVVWINFWATWCPPCAKELPDIQAVFDERKDEGLVVLAVDFQESVEQAQDFWDDRGLTMTVLLDSSGSVFEQYRLRGLPDSFFVDRDGILRDMQFGFLTEEQMREKLESAGLP